MELIIRAHEVVDEGYLFFAGGHLATIFSARNYAGRHENDGAFFVVRNDGLVIPKVLKARTRQPQLSARLWPKENQREVSPVRGAHNYTNWAT